MNSRRVTNRGFTLVEILIGVSILAIVSLIAIGLMVSAQKHASVMNGETGATNILNHISNTITSGKTGFVPTTEGQTRTFDYGQLSPAMGNMTGKDYADPGLYKASIKYDGTAQKNFTSKSGYTNRVKLARFTLKVCWKTLGGSGEECTDQTTYGPIPTTTTTAAVDDSNTNASTTQNRIDVYIDAEPYESGLKPNVKVTGPNGFLQVINKLGTRSFVPVTNGNYTVNASPITFNGYTYLPYMTVERKTNSKGYYERIEVVYKVGTGSISVAIKGLPANKTPNVRVNGNNGFTTTITSSKTIQDLPPGTYGFAADAITDGPYTYVAKFDVNPVDLKPNQTKAVTVTYEQSSGALDVKVTPPAGLTAKLQISGPGLKESFAASKTFNNLQPDFYTLSAENLYDSGTGMEYTPQFSPSAVMQVSAGTTSTVNVSFKPASSRLTVKVNAPAGIKENLDLTLSGQSNWKKTLVIDTTNQKETTGTFQRILTFDNLKPGTYSLYTEDTDAYNTTYRPHYSRNSVTMYAGQNQEVSIDYVVFGSVLVINTDAPVAFDRSSGISFKLKSDSTKVFKPQDKPQTIYYNVTPGDYWVDEQRDGAADLFPGKPDSWVRFNGFFMTVKPLPTDFKIDPGTVTTVNVPWVYGTGKVKATWKMYNSGDFSNELNTSTLYVNTPLASQEPESITKEGFTTTYNYVVPGTYSAAASVTCKPTKPSFSYCIPGDDKVYPPFVENADREYTVRAGETTNLNLVVSFHGGVEGIIEYPSFITEAQYPAAKLSLKGVTYGKTYDIESDGKIWVDKANNLPAFRRIYPDTYNVTATPAAFVGQMVVNPSSPASDQKTAEVNLQLTSQPSSMIIRPLQSRSVVLRYVASNSTIYMQNPQVSDSNDPSYPLLLQTLKAKITAGATAFELAPGEFRNKIPAQTVTVELPVEVSLTNGETYTLANIDTEKTRKFQLRNGEPLEITSNYRKTSRKITVDVRNFGASTAVPAFTVRTQDGSYSKTFTLSELQSNGSTSVNNMTLRLFTKDISVPNGKNQNIIVETPSGLVAGDLSNQYQFLINAASPTRNYDTHMQNLIAPASVVLTPTGASKVTVTGYPTSYVLNPTTSENTGPLNLYIFSKGALKGLGTGYPTGSSSMRVDAKTNGLGEASNASDVAWLYVQPPANDPTVQYKGQLKYSSKFGLITRDFERKTVSGKTYLAAPLEYVMNGTYQSISIVLQSDQFKTVILKFRNTSPSANTFTASKWSTSAAAPQNPLTPLSGAETRITLNKDNTETVAVFARSITDADGRIWHPYVGTRTTSTPNLAMLLDPTTLADGASVDVGYRNTTGQLRIRVTNDGDPVNIPGVKLSGPMNAFVDTTQEQIFTLSEGNYVLSGLPNSYQQNGVTYDVEVNSSNITVEGDSTANMEIKFTPKNAVLTLNTLNPTPVTAKGTLTYPDGSTQQLNLTGSINIPVTQQGRYTLTPNAFTHEGITYTSAIQTTLVYFGKSQVLTVDYGSSGGIIKFNMPNLFDLSRPYNVLIDGKTATMDANDQLGVSAGTHSIAFSKNPTPLGIVYILTPSVGSVTLAQNQTQVISVSSTTEMGTLEVTFDSPLVNGQRSGSVTLKNSDGVSRTLTPSGLMDKVTFSDVTPGGYTMVFNTTHTGVLPFTKEVPIWVSSKSVKTTKYTAIYGKGGRLSFPIYSNKIPDGFDTMVFGEITIKGVKTAISGKNSFDLEPNTYTATFKDTVTLNEKERLVRKTNSTLTYTLVFGNDITATETRYQYQEYRCVIGFEDLCVKRDWVDSDGNNEEGTLVITFDSPVINGQRSGEVRIKSMDGYQQSLKPAGTASTVTLSRVPVGLYNMNFVSTHTDVFPALTSDAVTVKKLADGTTTYTIKFSPQAKISFPFTFTRQDTGYTSRTFGTVLINGNNESILGQNQFTVPVGTYTANMQEFVPISQGSRWRRTSSQNVSVTATAGTTLAQPTTYQYQEFVCTLNIIGICFASAWQDR